MSFGPDSTKLLAHESTQAGKKCVICSREVAPSGTRKLECNRAVGCGLEQGRGRGPGSSEGSGDSAHSAENARLLEMALPAQRTPITLPFRVKEEQICSHL